MSNSMGRTVTAIGVGALTLTLALLGVWLLPRRAASGQEGTVAAGQQAGNLPRAADLKTDGRPSPARVFHVGDPAPKLSWTFQGARGKVQRAYQIEVLEGGLGGTPEATLTVYGGYDPAVLTERDVWRADVTDYRQQRRKWTGTNGQADEVPFRLARAPGKSHTYAWRVRVHDGEKWGPWSEWQSFTPNQIPYTPHDLSVRNPKEGERPGEVIAIPPRPQGQTIEVRAGQSLVAMVGRMRPGDSCVLTAGSYSGGLRIETPFLTLRAAEGAQGKAVLEGKVRLRRAEGIVLDGLVIKGGLDVGGPNSVVRNCSVFGPTRASGADSRFWDCYFEASGGGDTFEACGGGNGIEVIRCRVKAAGSGLRSGRPVVGCIYTENIVWGATSTGGLKSYDAQNLRWSYNVVYDCSRGVQLYRTAHDELYNNLFVNCAKPIFGSGHGTNILIRNNVLANSGGLMATMPGDRRFDVDYNCFYNIRGDRLGFNYWGAANRDPEAEQLAYRDGGHNLAADPAFTNPVAHDYRPAQRTALVTAGDPSFPVPAGGGSRVDIGCYESGGAEFPSTDWQPKWRVTDPTPTITWEFTDWDKEDGQGACQIQVDTSCYFDSKGLIHSGKLKGSTAFWRVPQPLKPGKYYFRVRVADDKQPSIFGLWSDNHYCFEVNGTG